MLVRTSVGAIARPSPVESVEEVAQILPVVPSPVRPKPLDEYEGIGPLPLDPLAVKISSPGGIPAIDFRPWMV
jgi:hypothetical protein